MKKYRKIAKKRQTPGRRWHVPPPLIHGPETLEGAAILNEWTDGAGVVLWQAFRDTMLWTTTDLESRAFAFAPAAAAGNPDTPRELVDDPNGPEVVKALGALRQIVANPVGVKEEQVARACRTLSEWAAAKGKNGTALAFAQNAALAANGNAAAAHWAATIARRTNDHARAESWFRRAVALARQSRDWRMYSLSFGGLGNLYFRRGNLPAARRLHTRALRGARRGGMRREQALALHDLFVVAIDTGNTGEAERLARQALEAFGNRSPRLHILAHDVAYFWLEQGHSARALSVFKAVLSLLERPIDRLLVLANIARAAGGTGDRPTVDAAVARIDNLIMDPQLRIAAGRALLEVARGYFALGSYDRAEVAALGSLASATEFREAKIQFAAESLIGAIRERGTATVAGKAPAETSTDYGDDLAADFVKALETMAGATH